MSTATISAPDTKKPNRRDKREAIMEAWRGELGRTNHVPLRRRWPGCFALTFLLRSIGDLIENAQAWGAGQILVKSEALSAILVGWVPVGRSSGGREARLAVDLACGRRFGAPTFRVGEGFMDLAQGRHVENRRLFSDEGELKQVSWRWVSAALKASAILTSRAFGQEGWKKFKRDELGAPMVRASEWFPQPLLATDQPVQELTDARNYRAFVHEVSRGEEVVLPGGEYLDCERLRDGRYRHSFARPGEEIQTVETTEPLPLLLGAKVEPGALVHLDRMEMPSWEKAKPLAHKRHQLWLHRQSFPVTLIPETDGAKIRTGADRLYPWNLVSWVATPEEFGEIYWDLSGLINYFDPGLEAFFPPAVDIRRWNEFCHIGLRDVAIAAQPRFGIQEKPLRPKRRPVLPS